MMTVPQAFEIAAWHQRSGRLKKAEALTGQILLAAPSHAESANNLGILLATQERLDEAVVAFRRAAQIRPDYADAHNNLGGVLMKKRALEEAIAAYSKALQFEPSHVDAWSNLGAALAEQGRLEEALAAHRRALELGPAYPQCHNNLAIALAERGDLNEAETAYRRALQLQPDYPEAKFNYSLLLLLRGDFEQGWPLYESRWDRPGSARRNFAQPPWDGGSIEGRRILLHAEQGFGDSIQFIRYASLVAERGGEVVVEGQRPLVELFRGARGVSEVCAAGDPLPPFDLHVPMHSLPLLFQTKIESAPAEVPYLFAEASRCEAWEARLGSDHARFRVGLAWAGSPENRWTAKRDLSPEMLLPLLRVPGVDFFSLQIGPGAAQIQRIAGATIIHDQTQHLRDFSDTAACMMKLDLIISVETAVAHLAGALGRPVWTLVPRVPAWRWGLESEASPWYPTMRLFRQPQRGDWAAVIQHATAELARVVRQ